MDELKSALEAREQTIKAAQQSDAEREASVDQLQGQLEAMRADAEQSAASERKLAEERVKLYKGT